MELKTSTGMQCPTTHDTDQPCAGCDQCDPAKEADALQAKLAVVSTLSADKDAQIRVLTAENERLAAMVGASTEPSGAGEREVLKQILRDIPAYGENGFFVEHVSPDGDPIGYEQIDPTSIIQNIQGIAQRALGDESPFDSAALASPAQAVQAQPVASDLVIRLREYAAEPGYSHNDYADTMREAADEIERKLGVAAAAAAPQPVARVQWNNGPLATVAWLSGQLPHDTMLFAAPQPAAQDLSASGLMRLWATAQEQATDTQPAPFQFARLLLAAPQPVAIPDALYDRIKEMKEAAYCYGDTCKSSVEIALDGVLDVMRELDAAAPAPQAGDDERDAALEEAIDACDNLIRGLEFDVEEQSGVARARDAIRALKSTQPADGGGAK